MTDAAGASAQSLGLDLKEEYVDTILATGSFTAPTQDVLLYTVPAKLFFRLTDVMVTNAGGQVCDFRFFVGGSQTNEFTV